jgi:hypothetical protein
MVKYHYVYNIKNFKKHIVYSNLYYPDFLNVISELHLDVPEDIYDTPGFYHLDDYFICVLDIIFVTGTSSYYRRGDEVYYGTYKNTQFLIYNYNTDNMMIFKQYKDNIYKLCKPYHRNSSIYISANGFKYKIEDIYNKIKDRIA